MVYRSWYLHENYWILIKSTDISKNSKFSSIFKREPSTVWCISQKYLIFSQISPTDWVQSYWKFTDFTDISDFTENPCTE